MKHFYLLLLFFGFNLIMAQPCPDRGFATGNLIYFVDDDNSFNCMDWQDNITVEGIAYMKIQCSTDLLTYETNDTPIADNMAFTANFGGAIGSCHFEANGTLPVEEFILNRTLSVFPNPLRYGNEITLSFGSPISAEISFYNMTGKKALVINIENSVSEEINLSSLTNGVYMLKIVKGDALVTRKIVITK
ncbi:T9SS type A sorting domain-containing protein [Aestuariivivens sediminis]|uniref:T9SS type A sorting domain-containing protein n=1 Tax=Aestuariivivens sediminis TaxID=2913557 RepID=UPI001F582507|nr:T9SS type A sorting domain-containing protein [Aestuariivivens sediminis]